MIALHHYDFDSSHERSVEHQQLHLAELDWPTLETRPQYFRLVMLYKMKNNNTPDYLQSILPPLQGQYANG